MHGLRKIIGILLDVVDLGPLRTALRSGNQESLVPPHITAHIPKLTTMTLLKNKSQWRTHKNSALYQRSLVPRDPKQWFQVSGALLRETQLGIKPKWAVRPPALSSLPPLSSLWFAHTSFHPRKEREAGKRTKSRLTLVSFITWTGTHCVWIFKTEFHPLTHNISSLPPCGRNGDKIKILMQIG